MENTFKNTNEIDIIYPGVGENYDFITEFKNLHHKKIFNLVRDEDLFAWKFAKRGFFKFKENIPKINQRILENFQKIIFNLVEFLIRKRIFGVSINTYLGATFAL